MDYTKYEHIIVKEQHNGTAVILYRHNGKTGTVINLRMPGIAGYLEKLNQEAKRKAGMKNER